MPRQGPGGAGPVAPERGLASRTIGRMLRERSHVHFAQIVAAHVAGLGGPADRMLPYRDSSGDAAWTALAEEFRHARPPSRLRDTAGRRCWDLLSMPIDPATYQAIRGLVQRHHVHFDVREELEADGDARRRTGHRVRLWAVVSGKRILPGDAGASLFAAALREVGQKVLPEDAGTTAIAIEETEPALYDSRVVPGADEIALDIVLHGGGGVADEAEERCLKAVCKTLQSVGAPQHD